MLLMLLAVALAGALAREPLAYAGIGLTTILLAVGYLLTIWWSQPGDHLPPWRATNLPEHEGAQLRDGAQPLGRTSNTRLYASTAVAAGVILGCGWALASTGDALAEQTNLGATFVGVVLVAASTSMPELSTTIAAVRLGNHQMAVSNILGTNCLEVALFFLGDAVYRGGPIPAATDRIVGLYFLR